MATYKRIVDVDTVTEATENMSILVEDTGSLKKVPMGNVINNGGAIEITCIHYDAYSPSSYRFGSYSEEGEVVNAVNLYEAMKNGVVFREEAPDSMTVADNMPSTYSMIIGYTYYSGSYIFKDGNDSNIYLYANYDS